MITLLISVTTNFGKWRVILPKTCYLQQLERKRQIQSVLTIWMIVPISQCFPLWWRTPAVTLMSMTMSKNLKTPQNHRHPSGFLDFLVFLDSCRSAYAVYFMSIRPVSSTSEGGRHVSRSSFFCCASYNLSSSDRASEYPNTSCRLLDSVWLTLSPTGT